MTFNLSPAVKNVLLYGVSIALMKGISLIMLPFITHYLSQDAFGRLEVLLSIAAFGSVIVSMGLMDALYRFAGSHKKMKDKKRAASEIYGIACVIALMAFSVLWFAAEIIVDLTGNTFSLYEVRLVLSVLVFEGCIAIPLGWLRMTDKVWTFFLVTTGSAITNALLITFNLIYGRGVEGILESGVIVATLQALVLAILHIRHAGIGFNLALTHKCIVYGLPIMLSGILAFTLNGFDRWLLAEKASMVDVANFAVAAKFALAVTLLMQPFNMWWMPRRFEVLFGQDGVVNAAKFTSLGITILLVITATVGLASPILITLLMPGEYAVAGQYAAVLVLAACLKELFELINLGSLTGETTYSVLIANIAGACTGVIMMFWLAPDYAVWGIAAALLAAHWVRVAVIFVSSQYLYPIQYPFSSLLATGLITAVSVSFSLQDFTLAYQAVTTVLGVTTVIGFSVWRGLFPLTLFKTSRAQML